MNDNKFSKILILEVVFLVLLMIVNCYQDFYLSGWSSKIEQLGQSKELIICKNLLDILIIVYIVFIVISTFSIDALNLKEDKLIKQAKLTELQKTRKKLNKIKKQNDSPKKKKKEVNKSGNTIIEKEYTNHYLEFLKKYMDTLAEL